MLGQNSSVVTGLTFTTPATISSPTGNYAIVPGGATAANYTISYVNGTLVVTPTPSPPVTPTTNLVTDPYANGQTANFAWSAISTQLASSSQQQLHTILGTLLLSGGNNPETVQTVLSLIVAINGVSAGNYEYLNGYIFPSSMRTPASGPTVAEQQCAVLVQALAGVSGTGYWMPVGHTAADPQGQTLQSGNAKPGDPIGTFMENGYYPISNESMNMKDEAPSVSNQPHSGIFLGYLPPSGPPVGFAMLAQSEGNKATIEYRLFQELPSSSPYSNISIEHWPYSVISKIPYTERNPYNGS
jgi:hypothetical protein